MVHNSRQLLKNLDQFIMTRVTSGGRCYRVSDVKRDGTVFVRSLLLVKDHG